MISPETLRRFPFFGFMNDKQLREVVMIAEEVTFTKGATILEDGQPAQGLYMLVEGSLDLYSTSMDDIRPELKKEFPVGKINQGEPFGITSMLEPYRHIATIRAATDIKAIRVDAIKLRELCKQDTELGYQLTYQIAKAVLERLRFNMSQLAAAN